MGEVIEGRPNTGHRIIFGDSRRMPEVADHSVHLVVTSPPYWQLKDYGGQEQIGYDQSYEDYINNLNLVWQECYRVIHPGCRLCINIGDQFARSTVYGRYKIIPIRTEIIRFCETMGFDYMGAIIWQKVTTCNTSGGGTVMGSFPFPRNGIVKLDYEFILLFRKLGTPPKTESKVREQSRLSKEEWNLYFSGHWQFPGARQKDHLAMFPEELPYRLIRMFSFVGETVLDPFLGSGTTTLVAERLDRSSIGYEVNRDYLPLIRERLGLAGSCEIVRRKPGGECLERERSKLPYLFRDPVVFDSKADPKQTSYESKINGTARPREDYLNVREVVSPELVRLSNGLLVRLIGVSENPGTRAEAVAFLQEKTRGRKVFLRLDERRYDGHGNLLCYLFLKNRTHLNAHLVKKGLVDVDKTSPFKHRSRFLRLQGVTHTQGRVFSG